MYSMRTKTQCKKNKKNCDKPANRASSSSLLLGTMLLVDGTKVQQGQWTPSFRPRLFSEVGRRRRTHVKVNYTNTAVWIIVGTCGGVW